MREEWWERPACIICDYWWAILLALILALTAYFLRDYWLPVSPPIPTPTRVTQLGTGDVQITLIWNSTNDIDLWATDPDGEKIFYGDKYALSGGELDVDANAGCNNLTTQPVENIFWPVGGAPRGKYEIEVNYYQQCEPDLPTAYIVRVLVDGRVTEYEGTLTYVNETHTIISFER